MYELFLVKGRHQVSAIVTQLCLTADVMESMVSMYWSVEVYKVQWMNPILLVLKKKVNS